MPTRGSVGCDTNAKQALVATTGGLSPQRSAFRPLLSHNVAAKRVKHQACLSVLQRAGATLWNKRNEVEFVGAGSNRSHAAWTEFMPVRVAKRRHHQERRANKVKGQRSKRKATVNLSHFSFHISPIYAKKGHPFKDVLFYKSGDDLLSHKCLQYHRRCWA